MDEKSTSNHRLLLAVFMVLLFGVIVLQYVCPSSDCQLLHLGSLSSQTGGNNAIGSRADGHQSRDGPGGKDPYVAEDGALARFVPRFNFTTADLNRAVDFNIKGDDVIVFLHIQKTGGTTFGRHLVRNIQLERPCECHAGQKKCTCYRPGKRETWLFSRFSTGWSCGLHADWTELTNCVPSLMNTREPPKTPTVPRNYYYITILRDPVWRYLSEWRHVQRGATWKASLHVCDGRAPTLSELPSCYPGDDWSGCSLADFMDCPYNLAGNRQTRMLADLSLVGCYNATAAAAMGGEDERWAVLLESAKRNLRQMAFFGLTEFQRKTQYLFERSFRLAFIAPFTQLNGTRAASVDVAAETQRRIRRLNRWDVQLYEYARDLFLQRFQAARQRERRQARERRQQERRRLRGGRAGGRLSQPPLRPPGLRARWGEPRTGQGRDPPPPPTPEGVEAEVRLPEWWDVENGTMDDYLDNVEQW